MKIVYDHDYEISLARNLGRFVELNSEDIAAIGSAIGPRRMAGARRDLVREGGRTGPAFMIVSGWACRYRMLEDGRRQIVGILLPGDMSDLDGSLVPRNDHSIGALGEVRYAEMSGSALERLDADRPPVMQALRRRMLVDLSLQREWTMNIGRRNATERIGHLFCELFFRLRAIGLADADGYDLPMTQMDLAEATGLTAIHVNRTMRQLRAAGLIVSSQRRMTIPDLDALMRASFFTPDYLHLDECPRRLDNEPRGSSMGKVDGRPA